MSHFYKYQGAGNDFVVFDNMDGSNKQFSDPKIIASLCDRRFGVGGDGLLLLSSESGYAFRMEYFNSDGSRASFCGNGARCICAFACKCGIVKDGEPFRFIADDGEHCAKIDESRSWVDLVMTPVDKVELQADGAYVLNTGVPHYVKFVDDLEAVDIMSEAPSIRFSELYKPAGVNVNFVHMDGDGHISLRTYERGVEGETLACGTGVTACAIASSFLDPRDHFDVSARGGDLSVSFTKKDANHFVDVHLCGPAVLVFEGDVNAPKS